MINNAPPLPRDRDLEVAVLGSLLFSESPDRVKEVRSMAPPECFLAGSREIYDALGDLADKGDSINPVMLADRLKDRGSKIEPAHLAEMLINKPIASDLTSEIAKLREFATKRAILRHAEHWSNEAQARDVDVSSLVERIKNVAGEFDSAVSTKRAPIAVSWGQACEMEFPPLEYVLNGIVRGEVVNCSAITERGKSTLWRNITLSMACGRGFAPIVDAGPARRILYLDFETRWPRLKPDITKMLGKFTQIERALISENFHVIADCRIDNWPLSLSLKPHWALLESEIHRIKPDVVVIDTLSIAFNIENEQDNGEATRIMKKMTALAEKWGCVVVFLHHIGKMKQEEGASAQAVYRSRGASAYSGCAHAIFNLLPDSASKERFTLECPKLKGDKWANTVYDVDKETRWCVEASSSTVKEVSPYDRLIALFNGHPMKRSAVLEKLSDFKAATVDRYLKEAVEAGDLTKLPGGIYQKPQNPIPYREWGFGVFPQTDESVEDSLDFHDDEKNVRGVFSEDPDSANEDRYLDAVDQ
jgi:hypothetical protein